MIWLKNGDCLIAGKSKVLLDWFCAKTNQPTTGWENASMISRIRDFKPVGPFRPIAVVLYNHFWKPDIWMHVAGESTWCTPDFLRCLFDYPFNELGCGRVTAIVARRNLKVRKLVSHLGFVREGRIREALPTGDDFIVYGMLRRECRWIEETSNEQAKLTRAA